MKWSPLNTTVTNQSVSIWCLSETSSVEMCRRLVLFVEAQMFDWQHKKMDWDWCVCVCVCMSGSAHVNTVLICDPSLYLLPWQNKSFFLNGLKYFLTAQSAKCSSRHNPGGQWLFCCVPCRLISALIKNLARHVCVQALQICQEILRLALTASPPGLKCTAWWEEWRLIHRHIAPSTKRSNLIFHVDQDLRAPDVCRHKHTRRQTKTVLAVPAS